MTRRESQLKPKTDIARFLLNSAILGAVFVNPELMQNICGPFTLPIASKLHLIFYVISLQVIRIGYKTIMNTFGHLPLLKWIPSYLTNLLIIKYILVLLLKVFVILDEEHRKKFYLHSFLLEGVILVMAILFDCIQKPSIKQAGQLLLIQGLHRLSLVYELTQTFCPNLILYYAVTNLLIFVLGQVQAQEKYGLKQSLYVKHDIYRFMFMSVLFFALAAIAQLTSYNFKMLITFVICFKFMVTALRAYNESRIGSAVNNLLIWAVIMAACEWMFTRVPFSVGATSGRVVEM